MWLRSRNTKELKLKHKLLVKKLDNTQTIISITSMNFEVVHNFSIDLWYAGILHSVMSLSVPPQL
jgi:hypothetical protein